MPLTPLFEQESSVSLPPMFEGLSEKIRSTVRTLSGKGKIRECDLEEVVKKIRLHLLEADVHYKVVKGLVGSLSERIAGSTLVGSLNPEEQFVGLLRQEIVELLGHSPELNMERVLIVGLQGSGKTTTAAKLGYYLNHNKRKTLLVPADMQRPAARDQLIQLGKDAKVDVFDDPALTRPKKIIKESLKIFSKDSYQSLIIDSAGRLQVDKELMRELKEMKQLLKPTTTLLVIDALIGQQALDIALKFRETLDQIDGIILSKIEGDARAGSSLSIRHITDIPIYFLGVGENFTDLEPFDPDRLAQRILGLGDLSGLVEKFERAIDNETLATIQPDASSTDLTLQDFLQQLKMLRKLGPLKGLLGMIPGAAKFSKQLDDGAAEKQLRKFEAIIFSMTPFERTHYTVLNGSRRKRIAQGSGVTVADINRFMKQFTEMKKMMKRMGPQGLGQLLRR